MGGLLISTLLQATSGRVDGSAICDVATRHDSLEEEFSNREGLHSLPARNWHLMLPLTAV